MTNLIENAFAINVHLIKDDLRKTRAKEPVEGYLNIVYNNKPSVVDYRIEYDDEKTYLVVALGEEPQKILLSDHELTFGTRTYLTCACGCRSNALYLNNGVFACRKCHKLRYESTTINRNSIHGKFLLQQSKILKLITIRESMGRIFYKSRFSKPFLRWLDLANRAGMTNEVILAQELMNAIESNRQ